MCINVRIRAFNTRSINTMKARIISIAIDTANGDATPRQIAHQDHTCLVGAGDDRTRPGRHGPRRILIHTSWLAIAHKFRRLTYFEQLSGDSKASKLCPSFGSPLAGFTVASGVGSALDDRRLMSETSLRRKPL